MRILIGADTVPTKSNVELFKAGDGRSLVGDELECLFRKADYRMLNLEAPLTDTESPIPKCGEALMAPIQCITGLKALNIDLVTLSNNHIMDQDAQGLKSTFHALEEADIAHVGAGYTLNQAAQPHIFRCEGNTIGVYACAEHEFSIADEGHPGANPIDLLESFDHVRALKQDCDYVIVLYHGGKEYYRFPSPNLQRTCRKLVDSGADLVVCQHSHCIGCEEKYRQGTILYGQGNFIFDATEDECWQTSLLIQILDGFEIDYIPLTKQGNGVRLADEERRKNILSAFYDRSHEIENPARLKEIYDAYAKKYITDLLSIASGKKYGYLTRALNKLVGSNKIIDALIWRKYTPNKQLTLLNRIECEAYNELFISGLKTCIQRERGG